MATETFKTRLISVRLQHDTLRKIDKLKKDMTYKSRSAIINNLLACVLDRADFKDLERMARYNQYRPWYNKVTYE